MSGEQARERFVTARVARLATVSAQGVPHLVPVTFAVVGDTVVSAVDAKPKSTRALRRLANVAANPFVCLLVDEYDDDWSRLWWVRADGRARVAETHAEPDAMTALVSRYAPYAETPPGGPLVVVDVERWSGWRAH